MLISFLSSTVRSSLLANDATIVSIFVNPAQFAPHEDLATYPRTLESDLSILSSISVTPSSSDSSNSQSESNSNTPRTLSALFLPPVDALYPSGITTEVSKQRGTFVEVKGLQEVMEGASRPGFFRGVATVVLKLFNIVQVSFSLVLSFRRIMLIKSCNDIYNSQRVHIWDRRIYNKHFYFEECSTTYIYLNLSLQISLFIQHIGI